MERLLKVPKGLAIGSQVGLPFKQFNNVAGAVVQLMGRQPRHKQENSTLKIFKNP